MAAARLKIGTGTQSRAVPDHLEASVFQVLHSPQALKTEDNGRGSKVISFSSFSINILTGFSIALHSTPSVFLRPSIVTISSDCGFFLWRIFSLLPPRRHGLSKSQSCYSSNQSRSNPSKCSSCIKTLLQASIGIQRSNRSALTPP